MKYAFAACGLALLASPVAAQEEPAPLQLDLVCPGRYVVIETTTANISGNNSETGYGRANARVSNRTMVPGTARLTIDGTRGELVYPDGRRRTLEGVAADERRITASYVLRGLFGLSTTWRVDIDRMTGGINVLTGEDAAFIGTCEAAPTAAKF